MGGSREQMLLDSVIARPVRASLRARPGMPVKLRRSASTPTIGKTINQRMYGPVEHRSHSNPRSTSFPKIPSSTESPRATLLYNYVAPKRSARSPAINNECLPPDPSCQSMVDCGRQTEK